MRDVAGKNTADESLFVNALDLLREGDRTAAIVVHTIDAHEHHGYVTPLTQDQLLRRDQSTWDNPILARVANLR